MSRYYIDGPLVVPKGVRMRGEATHLVSIYFKEQQKCTSPQPGYVYAAEDANAWALEDLTIYVTFFYHSVVHVGAQVTDFTMQRVRIRAVGWAFLAEAVPGASGRGGRTTDFTRTDFGPVVYLGGNTNWSRQKNHSP